MELRCGGDLEQVHAIEPIVTSSVSSCEELVGSGMDSGVYRLQDCELNSAGRDYYTRYCDMRTDGGGWTVSDLVATNAGSCAKLSMLPLDEIPRSGALTVSTLNNFGIQESRIEINLNKLNYVVL